MNTFSRLSLCLLLPFVMLSCSMDDPGLPPAEVRASEAIGNLKADLTAPANGWRLEYQPTPDAGIFFMILEFKDDGTVNIFSDVADNDGEFFSQTIPYRIDVGLSLELIFETYGVFHFMFEKDRGSFGAEFEFRFVEKEGNNLIFTSKSDIAFPSTLVFEPAQTGDKNLFSFDLAKNLNAFSIATPNQLEEVLPSQQIVLENLNTSVFWTFDEGKRKIHAEVVAEGLTLDEVLTVENFKMLDHSTGYTFSNGKIVLLEPLAFAFNGVGITISEIIPDVFDISGPSLCITGTDSTAKYESQIPGLGSSKMLNALLSTRGDDFQPTVYSVNVDFVFDGDGNSLAEDGSIHDKFPDASGFVMFYGVQLVNPDIPIYSVGLILEDGGLVLREYEPTDTKINFLNIELTNEFYYSDSTDMDREQDLMDVTNEIFAGGEVYAFELSFQNVFRLYNPCNKYEVFLVR